MAGILRQVAPFPINQVDFIYTRHPYPSPPTHVPMIYTDSQEKKAPTPRKYFSQGDGCYDFEEGH